VFVGQMVGQLMGCDLGYWELVVFGWEMLGYVVMA